MIQFSDLFGKAEHSVTHLELRDTYGLTEGFRAWQAGVSADEIMRFEDFMSWASLVRQHVERGISFRRARVISEPVSEFIRYENRVTANNVAAGEQVRWLLRPQAAELALPGADFWQVDDGAVWFVFQSGDGDPAGDRMCEDPAAARLCSSVSRRCGNAPSTTESTGPPDRIRTPVATTPSSSVAAARELIARRLREIMRDAGKTSRAIAFAAGWDESKCSRLLHGRTPPSDDDIPAWCKICGVPEQIPNLIAASRSAESAYMEFRRVQRSQKRMQVLRAALYEQTSLYRIYSSNFVPWPLQTARYIWAVMENFNRFHEAGNTDISEGVEERLSRQRRYLHAGKRRCELIVEEAVLYDRTFSDEIMREQLAHLLAGSRLPGMSLGIIARGSSRPHYAAETFTRLSEFRGE